MTWAAANDELLTETGWGGWGQSGLPEARASTIIGHDIRERWHKVRG